MVKTTSHEVKSHSPNVWWFVPAFLIAGGDDEEEQEDCDLGDLIEGDEDCKRRND